MRRREVKVDFRMGFFASLLFHLVCTQIVQNDMELLKRAPRRYRARELRNGAKSNFLLILLCFRLRLPQSLQLWGVRRSSGSSQMEVLRVTLCASHEEAALERLEAALGRVLFN